MSRRTRAAVAASFAVVTILLAVIDGGEATAQKTGCSDDRQGLRYYRATDTRWRVASGLGPRSWLADGRTCAQARHLAKLARDKSRGSRRVYERALHDPRFAIHLTFGPYGDQAVGVSWCESHLSTKAQNGQYLGLFQMGSSERRTFGHGSTAIAQCLAARRYFERSGRDWSPWSCRWAAY